MNPRKSRAPRPLATSPFNRTPPEPAEPEVYAVNDRVCHDKYGLGTIARLDGADAVIVDFGSELRRIPVPSPKFMRL